MDGYYHSAETFYILKRKRKVSTVAAYLENRLQPKPFFSQVILITPEMTSVLECTEASQTFSDAPVAGLERLDDVYTMALDHASQEVREQVAKCSAVFVHTVFEFLQRAKVISYA